MVNGKIQQDKIHAWRFSLSHATKQLCCHSPKMFITFLLFFFSRNRGNMGNFLLNKSLFPQNSMKIVSNISPSRVSLKTLSYSSYECIKKDPASLRGSVRNRVCYDTVNVKSRIGKVNDYCFLTITM